MVCMPGAPIDLIFIVLFADPISFFVNHLSDLFFILACENLNSETWFLEWRQREY